MALGVSGLLMWSTCHLVARSGQHFGQDMSPLLSSFFVFTPVITGDVWPTHGEIDIIEGVNLVTQNQMGLHTLPGY